MLSYEDFKRIEIKTAKILGVKDHPSADRLYLLDIDIGSETMQIVAGIKKFYTPQELIGKNIIVVTNLAPAIIRGVESKAMLLAASDDNNLSVITLDKDMPAGLSIK
jgi:methionyl-tRNA synthetase